ncbi:division abnormally delayed protein isoform X2 [Cephus cinctus]|uniref:Division abnormally delayed protein isoform X2 n=1 Tax=Cephus cinctus TaxID=211228 RepID=A0AAJ7RIC2_CEPCN|nr:division abnormally delayed protein isoform X2 [Cephus cinctus]
MSQLVPWYPCIYVLGSRIFEVMYQRYTYVRYHVSVIPICGGNCCDPQTEERIKQQARSDFHYQIHHHSRSHQGLLAITADALRDSMTSLARQSENKTLNLFNQVYRSMAVQSRPSIKALYQAMIDYVAPSNTPVNLEQPLTRSMLKERFSEFFTKLFPIAYHHAVNPHQQDFSPKFKSCLYEIVDRIKPFGDIPDQISASMAKSLEATRVLIQALDLGKTVLDKTDTVLFSGSRLHQEACNDALMKMTYCPKCKGITEEVEPCHSLCTNVMRGCLTQPASEMDPAWSGYVYIVERLVAAVDGPTNVLELNTERAMRQLDTHISDAIMHAMEDGPALEEKVRTACGRAELNSAVTTTNSDDSSAATLTVVDASTLPSPFTPRTPPNQLHVQLGNFLASVERSRTFYGNLADTICEEYPDKHCWNGERIGEYTKTVVDSSLGAQKYNPEFKLTAIGTADTSAYSNPNISELIDQLRHITQVVQSHLTYPSSAIGLLADEAADGSGSGWRPEMEDDDDGRNGGGIHNRHDDEDDDGNYSGSGMGSTTIDPVVKGNENIDGNLATGISSRSFLTLLLLFCTIYVPLAA